MAGRQAGRQADRLKTHPKIKVNNNNIQINKTE
jgi:hypothetical protein